MKKILFTLCALFVSVFAFANFNKSYALENYDATLVDSSNLCPFTYGWSQHTSGSFTTNIYSDVKGVRISANNFASGSNNFNLKLILEDGSYYFKDFTSLGGELGFGVRVRTTSITNGSFVVNSSNRNMIYLTLYKSSSFVFSSDFYYCFPMLVKGSSAPFYYEPCGNMTLYSESIIDVYQNRIDSLRNELDNLTSSYNYLSEQFIFDNLVYNDSLAIDKITADGVRTELGFYNKDGIPNNNYLPFNVNNVNNSQLIGAYYGNDFGTISEIVGYSDFNFFKIGSVNRYDSSDINLYTFGAFSVQFYDYSSMSIVYELLADSNGFISYVGSNAPSFNFSSIYITYNLPFNEDYYFYCSSSSTNGSYNLGFSDASSKYTQYINDLQNELYELENSIASIKTNEYNKGFNAGMNSDTNFASLFFAYADIPFHILSNLLDFDIFGFNMVNVYLSLISFSLLLWVIRKLIK